MFRLRNWVQVRAGLFFQAPKMAAEIIFRVSFRSGAVAVFPNGYGASNALANAALLEE
jgi:hypothetical protein